MAKVGFEIEYNNVSIQKTAEIIKDLFGSKIKEHHKNRIDVVDTKLGDFSVELDAEIIQKLADKKGELPDDLLNIINDNAEEFVGILVPREIVCPPVPEGNIADIDKLRKELYENGAKGTESSVFYAYGLHINHELKDITAENILSYLRAYIELKEEFDRSSPIDFSRKLTGFVADFNNSYKKKVMDGEYDPDMDQLIDDYIEYNPSRNRALDLMPLFKFIDKNKIEKLVGDERIKARPTFHFRLPDCRIGESNWSIFTEWEKWQKIERTAKNKRK